MLCILQKMEKIIHELRMDYSEMSIAGLLLVYPTCYIHVLEVFTHKNFRFLSDLYDVQNCTIKITNKQ